MYLFSVLCCPTPFPRKNDAGVVSHAMSVVYGADTALPSAASECIPSFSEVLVTPF